jgi:hypothetical protein
MRGEAMRGFVLLARREERREGGRKGGWETGLEWLMRCP